MNKNRGLTPLAVVLMLSGSLALTGCDDKPAQQGAQHMPEVGIVTLKSAPLQITTELPKPHQRLSHCGSPSSGQWHYFKT